MEGQFAKKLEQLRTDIQDIIDTLSQIHEIKSKFSDKYVADVKDKKLMFNLKGDRYKNKKKIMEGQFTKRLEQIRTDIQDFIDTLIQAQGVKSKFSDNYVVDIKDEELMFNLEGGRYLVEITKNELIDNYGYSYNIFVLNDEQLCEIADYLKRTANISE